MVLERRGGRHLAKPACTCDPDHETAWLRAQVRRQGIDQLVGKATYGTDQHLLTNEEFAADWAEGD